jgi:hypothetical protein
MQRQTNINHICNVKAQGAKNAIITQREKEKKKRK